VRNRAGQISEGKLRGSGTAQAVRCVVATGLARLRKGKLREGEAAAEPLTQPALHPPGIVNIHFAAARDTRGLEPQGGCGMATMICLETGEGEIFIDLDHICQAEVTTDTVQVQYASGQQHTFTGPAAHVLIQALRHAERRAAQRG